MGKGNDPNCAQAQPFVSPLDGAPGPSPTGGGYDPGRVRAAAVTLDAGPVSFDDLPEDLRDDEDVLRNFDARYGTTGGMTFELVQIRLADLQQALPADHRAVLDQIRAQGSDFYRSLDARWQEEYAEELADDPDADPWDIDDEYPDGDRRAQIVDQYRHDVQDAGKLLPLILDLHNLDGGVDVLDGFHRIAGASLAGRRDVRLDAYLLLPEED